MNNRKTNINQVARALFMKDLEEIEYYILAHLKKVKQKWGTMGNCKETKITSRICEEINLNLSTELHSFRFMYGRTHNKNHNKEVYPDISINWIGKVGEQEKFLDIECKRINGSRVLAGKYIENGINRFLSQKYLTLNGYAFMIAYVQKEDANINRKIINKVLAGNKFKISGCETIQELAPGKNFEVVFNSKHKNNKVNKLISIKHFMFDCR